MNLSKLKTVSQCWDGLGTKDLLAKPSYFVFSFRCISYFLPKGYLSKSPLRQVDFCCATKLSKSTDVKTQHDFAALEEQTNISVETSKAWKKRTPSSMESVFERFYNEAEFRSQLSKKLEKIEVQHRGHDKNLSVRVNRNYSTPLDIARHLGQNYVRLSAAARLSNGRLLDMNQPICETERAIKMELMWFKNQKGQDPTVANKTLWNTMSLISASLLDTMFKDTIVVTHRGPSVNLNVESGVFGYEFELTSTESTDKTYNWRASEDELVLINRKLQRFLNSRPQIYGLDGNLPTCERIFGESNSFKLELARELLSSVSFDGDQVRIYSCGTSMVDIHPGCLLPSTELIGQALITSIYPLKSVGQNGGTIHRIEGVALPTVLPAHHSAWSVIVEAAKEDSKQREHNTNDENHQAFSTEQFVSWYVDQHKFRNNQLQNSGEVVQS